MSKSNRVKVTVLGSGLTYKGEVDVSVAGQIIGLCLSENVLPEDNNSIRKDVDRVIASGSIPSSRESVSEYFNRYNPKRNPDKILTLACFLRDIKGQESFTVKDIKSLFRDVGELLPANFKRDFSWASKKNAWLGAEPGTKNAYFVTTTGAKALEAGFSKEVLEKTKITNRGRVRTKRAKK